MYDWTIHEYIIGIYEKRKQDTPHFSIRAFARHLNISDSTLSKILRKQRPIGKALATKLERKLNVKFNKDSKVLGRKTLHFRDLELEQNEQDYPWYFFPLIEYIKLMDEIDLHQLSRQLDAPPQEIEKTLELLVSRNIIKKNGTSYKANPEPVSGYLNPPTTSASAKKYQHLSLKKSVEALASVDFEKRIHNSMYFRFDSKQMNDVRSCFKTFYREMSRITFKHARNADSIYCMQASAFPVIQSQKGQIL